MKNVYDILPKENNSMYHSDSIGDSISAFLIYSYAYVIQVICNTGSFPILDSELQKANHINKQQS